MNDFKSFLTTGKSATAAAKKVEKGKQKPVRRILPHPEIVEPLFHINHLPLFSSLSPETKRWIRDSSDERSAIEFGCRFSEQRGEYTVKWIESNCILYEGTDAGKPFGIEDWQYEFFMQGWGWLWFSKEWAVRTKQEKLGWIRRFRKISGWIPKKNGKSPTLAAAGLYTLMADGENGMKCFSVALDQKQALLAHTHAVEFVNQSPALRKRCQVYKNTGEIYDHLTKSSYTVRSGSKAGAQVNSNEGINGCLFIDETHVVDEQQMAVLKRAGISRRQFIHVQLSTAGSNTAGYGYKECISGRENIKAAGEGRRFNFRLKHFEFGCHPDTSLDDIRNPDKIDALIDEANPTVGRIVLHDVLKQDWEESKHSDTLLTEFGMYSLNLWATGGGAFIAGSDWQKCYKPFPFSFVKKFPCVIGADWASKRDFCAIMLGFCVPVKKLVILDPFDPDCVEYRQVTVNMPHIHPYFFLPRKAVEKYRKHINLDDYASRGLLHIVEGATIRPDILASWIVGLDRKFEIRKVASDNVYSGDIAAILASQHGWDIESDYARYAQIGTAASTVSPAIEQLRALILNKELVHKNHELLNWQLANVCLIEDKAGHKRFEKRTSDDWRKIDGWQALVNMTFVMMSDPELYPGQTFSIGA